MAVGTYGQLADYLVNGYWDDQGGNSQAHSWANTNVSYNYQDMPQSDRKMIDLALKLWSDVSKLKFTKTTGTADITFINDNAGAYASASYFIPSGNMTTATVNVSPSWGGGQGTDTNSYRLQTFIHEIGHALGLGHPGDYDGSASYPSDATFDNDSWQLSIMSYFSQTENTTVNASYAYVLTPQLVDIMAIQDIYGADTVRSGNTTYGNSNNTGREVYGAFKDSSGFPSVTIYDSGGTDTMKYTGTSEDQRINLKSGSTSSVYGEKNNIIIYPDTVIERAKSGSGDDILKGNASRNVLSGGNGKDDMYGDKGDDTLIGGRHRDKMWGGADNDRFDFNSAKDSAPGSQRDQLRDFDRADDLIDLRDIDAKSGSGNQSFKWIGKSKFHDKKGELRYEDKGSKVIVQGDVNGDSKADFEIYVFTGKLGENDFLL